MCVDRMEKRKIVLEVLCSSYEDLQMLRALALENFLWTRQRRQELYRNKSIPSLSGTHKSHPVQSSETSNTKNMSSSMTRENRALVLSSRSRKLLLLITASVRSQIQENADALAQPYLNASSWQLDCATAGLWTKIYRARTLSALRKYHQLFTTITHGAAHC